MNEFLFTEDFVFPDFLLVNRDDVTQHNDIHDKDWHDSCS